MVLHNDNTAVGFLEGLRARGFWAYFSVVAGLVFVLLTAMDFVLPYIYGQDRPGLNVDFLMDIGINIAIGLISAGFAWKVNGTPLINRPDTIKLDLND